MQLQFNYFKPTVTFEFSTFLYHMTFPGIFKHVPTSLSMKRETSPCSSAPFEFIFYSHLILICNPFCADFNVVKNKIESLQVPGLARSQGKLCFPLDLCRCVPPLGQCSKKMKRNYFNQKKEVSKSWWLQLWLTTVPFLVQCGFSQWVKRMHFPIKGRFCASFHSSSAQNEPTMCCLLHLSWTRCYNGELWRIIKDIFLQ